MRSTRVDVEARRACRPRAGCCSSRPGPARGSVKSWVSTMSVAPLGRSPRLAFSAAGFIATRTSGRSPGGQDVVVGEVQLEGRDAGQRALRGADLGREVREGREVVAEDRGLLGEPVAGELHAVAGVAGDPDDDPVELLDVLGHAGECLRLDGAATPVADRNLFILRSRASAAGAFAHYGRATASRSWAGSLTGPRSITLSVQMRADVAGAGDASGLTGIVRASVDARW